MCSEKGKGNNAYIFINITVENNTNKKTKQQKKKNCVKIVFGVPLFIFHSEYWKVRNRKTLNTDSFHAVGRIVNNISPFLTHFMFYYLAF